VNPVREDKEHFYDREGLYVPTLEDDDDAEE